MRRAAGGEPVNALDFRRWRDSLGLSESDTCEALNFQGDPHDTITRIQSGRRSVSPPTALLMDQTAVIVVALAYLRDGRTYDAGEILRRIMTPALLAAIDQGADQLLAHHRLAEE